MNKRKKKKESPEFKPSPTKKEKNSFWVIKLRYDKINISNKCVGHERANWT
jgi:hypothetical protein